MCRPCVNGWYEARRPRRFLDESIARPEHWLPIVGYEDSYEVSDYGQVHSLDRWITVISRGGTPYRRFWPGQVLKQFPSGSGYLFITLSQDGRTIPCDVHRLVLRAFAGPCPPGKEARHGPGGKHDNRWPENLCYGTHPENMDDQVRDGTMRYGSARGHARLNEAIVLECRLRCLTGGESRVSLAREFHVSAQTMDKAVAGVTWRHVATV